MNQFLYRTNLESKGRAPALTLDQRILRRKEQGFTLIELMIAVAVVAIISGIAITSYKSSVMKANRSAAKSALLDLAAREEKFYTLNNTYSSTPTDLYGSTTTVTFPINIPGTGPALYTIAAPAVTAASTTTTTPTFVTITATPTGSQSGDQCGNFIINSFGQQSVTGSGTCW